MAKKLKGLAIGGALAGHIIENDDKFYRHYLPIELSPIPPAPMTPEETLASMREVVTNYEEYAYLSAFTGDPINGEVSFGYWVPRDKLDQGRHFIFTELNRTYAEANDEYATIEIKTVDDWVRLATRTVPRLNQYAAENGCSFDATEAATLLAVKEYRRLHLKFERLWAHLPDSPRIRFQPFFDLCDLCSEAWVLTDGK